MIKCLSTGMFKSNCYIVSKNKEAVLIDAGAEVDEVCEVAKQNNLKIKYIFLTHGHIDHICSADKIRDKTDAKILVHKLDEYMLKDANANLSLLFEKNYTVKPDILINDGDIFEVCGMKLEIIHTPGHTKGGCCIKFKDYIFTGDTLFKNAIGRTDLAGGDYKQIIDSIKEKLMTLEDSLLIYPGHGKTTTIGFEKKHNIFL